MRLQWLALLGLFVVSASALIGTTRLDVSPQHIVVMSIPLNGHYFPLKAVAEELLTRGHRVTILTETASWCSTTKKLSGTSEGFRCVVLPASETFSPAMLERVSAMPVLYDSFPVLFEEMVSHHNKTLGLFVAEMDKLMASEHPPTAVFGDASTFVSFSIAAKYDLPRVQMFPLVLRLSLGPATWLPGLGQGLPREMTTAMRINNAILDLLAAAVVSFIVIPQLNEQRAAYGIRPFKNVVEIAGGYDITLAPTIWPYDVPQPLCPNVVPLGTLVPDHGVQPMEPELVAFLDQCTAHGAVYVNFGTLSVLSDRLREELQRAFFADGFKPCVVWKPNKKHFAAVQQLIEDHDVKSRVYIATYFNNAFEIMKHPSVRAFITHCGDTSFGEAVEAGLPLIGIPFFADQSDVCQRMHESNVGIYLGHKDQVTAADVTRAITETFANHAAIRARLEKLQDMAARLGGAARGADFVEAHAAYRLGDSLSCADLDPVILGSSDADGVISTSRLLHFVVALKVGQWDLFFATKVLPCMALMYVVWAIVSRCCCGGRRKKTPEQGATKKRKTE